MAFTKINAAGIGTTERVTVDGLTVINNLSVGGTVSIAGTLTYEDVTNVDAVGLITARAGIKVGSGVTLSPDGHIFTTGITTVGKSVFLSGNNPNIRFDDSDTTNNGEITLDNSQLRIEVDEDDSISSSVIKFRVDGSDQVSINSNGDLTIKDKIVHTGDANTSIRFPAADTVTIETVGSEKLRVASNGNITQTAASGETIFTLKRSDANVTGSTGTINFAASDGHSVASIMALGDGDNEGANLSFRTTSAAASDDPYDSSITEKLNIGSDGHVTIGSASGRLGINTDPDTILHVYSPIVNHVAKIESGDTDVHLGLFDNTTTGVYLSATGDNLIFETSGFNERVRIDSDGRLMIATSSTTGISANGDDIIIGSIGSATDRGITFATTATGSIRWADAGDNAMGRIQYDNNSDVMLFMTSNATRIRLDSDGGIKFGSDTAAANALDDYEEGTFTPTYINLNVPGHATTNYATYTKVGRLVTIRLSVSISSSVSDSSGIGFALPFAPLSNERVVIPAISDRSGSNKDPFAFVNVNQNSNVYAKTLDGYSFQSYNTFSGNYIVVTGSYEAA